MLKHTNNILFARRGGRLHRFSDVLSAEVDADKAALLDVTQQR
jgi:hypothetical protein